MEYQPYAGLLWGGCYDFKSHFTDEETEAASLDSIQGTFIEPAWKINMNPRKSLSLGSSQSLGEADKAGLGQLGNEQLGT